MLSHTLPLLFSLNATQFVFLKRLAVLTVCQKTNNGTMAVVANVALIIIKSVVYGSYTLRFPLLSGSLHNARCQRSVIVSLHCHSRRFHALQMNE
jgi:hypothetical protein